jgi:hypothetical protein
MADAPEGSKQQQSSKKAIGRPFPSGVSGNPGGRPKMPDWLADRSLKALEYIADVADGTEQGIEPALRLKAAQILVERHFGKPTEVHEVDQTVTMVESRTVRLIRAEPSEKVVEAIAVADRQQLDAE